MSESKQEELLHEERQIRLLLWVATPVVLFLWHTCSINWWTVGGLIFCSLFIAAGAVNLSSIRSRLRWHNGYVCRQWEQLSRDIATDREWTLKVQSERDRAEAKATAAEKETKRLQAQLDRVLVATALVVHEDIDFCNSDDCGCLSLSPEDAVDSLRLIADQLQSQVKELEQKNQRLRQNQQRAYYYLGGGDGDDS